ncbi:MAG: DUF1566 domain-containing protein [Bacteroidia bacterium]|nr:DUF1566 domain-containing protein [Bacteroidia bacterium]
MKNKKLLLLLFATLLSAGIYVSCKRFEFERKTLVSTDEILYYDDNVIAKGTIFDISPNPNITEYGFCWGINSTPTINDNKKSHSITKEKISFIDTIHYLTTKKFYLRAYVIDGADIKYGDVISVYFTVQQRLYSSETPKQIYDSGVSIDSLYGKTYQGGLIFYLNTSTGSGLVSAVSDQSTNAQWGCYGTEITGVDGTAIGTGEQNTIDIINGCSAVGTAAKICRNYSGGGFNDWFLPSTGELQAMFSNLCARGFGNFHSYSYFYWSSTEDNYIGAWEFDFVYHGVQGRSDKTSQLYVRAVRAF